MQIKSSLYSLVFTSEISILSKITKINFPLRITETKQKEFSFEFAVVPPIAYARSRMLVLMLMSMLMSHASVDLYVLSFVLSCAYAYVAGENQAYQVYKFLHTHNFFCVFFVNY